VNEWQVREASERDADFIVKMIEAAAKEGKFHSVPPSREEFHRYSFENPRENYVILIAQEKDEVVGYIDSDVRRGVGFILGLYVRPASRTKGVGTALMKRMMDHLVANGCHKARLEVFLDNGEAIDFYRHRGFETEGFLRKDEEKRDTIIMSRFF
jgi:ribosomal protein S18 acetylase RimI-like enzyme